MYMYMTMYNDIKMTKTMAQKNDNDNDITNIT